MEQGMMAVDDGSLRNMARSGLAVLLVEDDENHAALFERSLKAVDPQARVLRFDSGEPALDYFQGLEEDDQLPDLIVLDLKLPGINGLKVLSELKSSERTKVIPTVVLTSSDAASDRSEAYLTYANSYVLKPIDGGYRRVVSSLCEYWKSLNRPAPGRADTA